MHTMSPMRVAQNRAARLSATPAYSTTTKAAHVVTKREAEAAFAEIRRVAALEPEGECCFECWLGPREYARHNRLWRLVESYERRTGDRIRP